jgi:hypothetical protein
LDGTGPVAFSVCSAVLATTMQVGKKFHTPAPAATRALTLALIVNYGDNICCMTIVRLINYSMSLDSGVLSRIFSAFTGHEAAPAISIAHKGVIQLIQL